MEWGIRKLTRSSTGPERDSEPQLPHRSLHLLNPDPGEHVLSEIDSPGPQWAISGLPCHRGSDNRTR